MHHLSRTPYRRGLRSCATFTSTRRLGLGDGRAGPKPPTGCVLISLALYHVSQRRLGRRWRELGRHRPAPSPPVRRALTLLHRMHALLSKFLTFLHFFGAITSLTSIFSGSPCGAGRPLLHFAGTPWAMYSADILRSALHTRARSVVCQQQPLQKHSSHVHLCHATSNHTSSSA